MNWRKRKRRVRLHLTPDGLPSVEGLLVSNGRGDFVIAVPKLLTLSEGPVELDSRWLTVPRDRVAFYEVLS